MPVYNPYIDKINIEEVKRYAGLDNCNEFPEKMLKEACLKGKTLIAPKAIWHMYPYDSVLNKIMSPVPVYLNSNSITAHLEGAIEVAVFAVTIGVELEEEVSNMFIQGNYTEAILLDAVGSCVTEQAVEQLVSMLAHQAARNGHIIGRRYSPGYGDWPISAQKDIVEISHADIIGIKLTTAMMLVPRKSVTAIIGLYPYQNALSMPSMQEEVCESCNHIICQYKKSR